MRVVIQRVLQSSVFVDNIQRAKIGPGLLVLLGIEAEDSVHDLEWLTKKIIQLRIFPDENQHMNLDIMTLDSPEILLISQFTLHASTKKGNRPSFIKAARPDVAIPLYEAFAEALSAKGIYVGTGVFGADMKVHLINDGPVTIIIDSKNKE
jgi:D-tyrosyl-tRNA(Tyr) deacylase